MSPNKHCLLPSLAYSTNPLFNCSTLHLHKGPPTSNITTPMLPKTQSAPKEFQYQTISHINTMPAFNSNAQLPTSTPALSAHQEIDAVGGCKCTHRWWVCPKTEPNSIQKWQVLAFLGLVAFAISNMALQSALVWSDLHTGGVLKTRSNSIQWYIGGQKYHRPWWRW